MATSFVQTGSIYNLTRIQLEQIRKADYYSGGLGLTIGDGGDVTGGTGVGAITDENYFSNPTLLIDDTDALVPLGNPGEGIGSLIQTADLGTGELSTYYGPTTVGSATTGFSASTTTWQDNSTNFTTLGGGVHVGDVVCIKVPSGASGDTNSNVTGVVSVVATHVLTLTSIVNPNTSGTTLTTGASTHFNYVILRPGAVQLFALPGSGPLGQEQTFLAVVPGSSLHNNTSPTVAQIDAGRVTNLISPRFVANPSTQDRADTIFFGNSLDKLGYRLIIYPDNGAGGPNLASPIPSPNPTIDPTKTDPTSGAQDTRMTIDYKAGIVRFSTAPTLSGQIKVAGGTNATTGRLNLYAVFFAVSANASAQGAARQLVSTRTQQGALTSYKQGRVYWDGTNNVWRAGSTSAANEFVVQALDSASPDNDFYKTTKFGVIDTTNASYSQFRGFVYRSATGYGNVLKFVRNSPAYSSDDPKTQEMVVADKTMATVSDASNPPLSPADYVAPSPLGFGGAGARAPHTSIIQALSDLTAKGYGKLHLRRGYYNFAGQNLQTAISVPPGIEIEGEGDATVLKGHGTSIFKFGPNTPWGVWDPNQNPVTGTYTAPPTTTSGGPTGTAFNWSTDRLEGFDMCWNPVRRVWGVVHADTTSNQILMNEVATDGTLLYASSAGLNIKDFTGNNLYTYAGTNGSNHTGGHYPRIAHNSTTDDYIVVWVEQVGDGPQVRAIYVEPFGINPSPVTTLYAEGGTYVLSSSPFGSYSDHPSVAVYSSDPTNSLFYIAISFAAYGSTPTPQALGVSIYQFNGGLNLLSTGYYQPTSTLVTQPVISSTDVAFSDNGDFQVVFTQRDHPLYCNTNGTLDIGTNSASQSVNTLTDSSVANWGTLGVTCNSKVLVYNVGFPYFEGYVADDPPSGSSLSFFFDNQTVSISSFSGLYYAVVPSSGVFGVNFCQQSGSWQAGSVTPFIFASDTSTDQYFSLAPREVDYCRISAGGGGWFVAFQMFDTTSYLNAVGGYPNFDNGISTAFPETGYFGTGKIPIEYEYMGYPNIYRHHIGVFGCLLTPTGSLANQQTLTSGTLASNVDLSDPGYSEPPYSARLALETAKTDYISSNYSLGSRGPSQPYPNSFNNAPTGTAPYPDRTFYGYAIQISPRNHFYSWGSIQPTTAPIANGPPPSLIPDITWTGTDWTIVSPVNNRIYSDSGNYYLYLGNYYLTDATFYFGGANSSNPDGLKLRQTLPTGTKIYFPDIGQTIGLTGTTVTFSVVSEHTIQLSGSLSGLATSAVKWYLILPDTPGMTGGGIKNLGYRVSADGRVIMSSCYTTFADEVSESGTSTQLILDETLRRPHLNTGDFSKFPNTANFESHAYGYYGTSRIEYDVGFQGVAVGAPKGCNQNSSDEQPCVAIAWGENFYGFLDRNVAGDPSVTGSHSNRTIFYRQSFGPYRNGLKDLRIDMSEGATSNMQYTESPPYPPAILNLKSRVPILTRHGMPASCTTGFATDGYRNLFVSPVIRGTTTAILAQTATANYNWSWNGFYTDAVGRYAIRTSGPTVGTSFVGGPQPPADLYSSAGGTGLYNKTSPLSPSRSEVIWNGSNFVAFYMYMEGRSSNIRQAYLAMAQFPGGEDNNCPQGQELTDAVDFRFDPQVLEIATLTAGAGSSSTTTWPSGNNWSEATPQFSVAWSGKVYAALWVMGVNPGSDDNLGGSTIGISIFHGTGTGSGTTTYTIASTFGLPLSDYHAVYTHPHIVWDGKAFVATWLFDDGPSDTGRIIQYVVMPESGFGGSASQVKAASFVDHNGSTPSLGTLKATSGTATNRIYLNSAVNVQPGDVIHILSATGATTGPPTTFYGISTVSGSYQVIDVTEDSNGMAAVFSTNPTALSLQGYNGGFPALYGFITSRGVSEGAYVPTQLNSGVIGTASPVGNAVNSDPKTLLTGQWSLPAEVNSGSFVYATGNGNGPVRVSDMIYDEIRDRYVILFHSTDANDNADTVYLTAFNRTKGLTQQEVLVYTAITGFTSNDNIVSTLGWNGRHYFVAVYDPYSSQEITYFLYNPNLVLEETQVVDTLPGIINFTEGTKPGPLYGSEFTSNLQTQLRSLQVKWNNRLNRWLLVGSVLWSTDAAGSVSGTAEIPGTTSTDLASRSKMTAYSNYTITLASPSVYPQPGTRISLLNGVSSDALLANFTVMGYSGSTALNVDIASTETLYVSDIESNNGYTMGNSIREDTFLWTLSYNTPAVVFEDADETHLDNVTFGGGIDVEERWFRMARPMWQVSGSAVGQVQNAVSNPYENTSTLTPGRSHYNHCFLTPMGKVELPRYSNVRSRTKVKYGWGRIPGSPYVDLYALTGLNRRG